MCIYQDLGFLNFPCNFKKIRSTQNCEHGTVKNYFGSRKNVKDYLLVTSNTVLKKHE